MCDISTPNYGIKADGTIANPVGDRCAHGCGPDEVVMLVERAFARLLGNLNAGFFVVGFHVTGIMC